jgi:hypothetical protein
MDSAAADTAAGEAVAEDTTTAEAPAGGE